MKSRPRLFFLLVFYIFASFIWWSYLLLQKNEETFEERIALQKLTFIYENNPGADALYYETPQYKQLQERYMRQKLMIISEGVVFLLLLWIGSLRLWRTFNKEIALARQQNNFLLSITHELRSPLASMKLSLQTLLKRVVLEDKFRKLTENSVDDVDRLTALVDNILYAARMEDRSFALQKELENISVITNNVVQKIEATHKDTVQIRINVEDDIMIKTDKMAFTSLLHNLVENAIKYSPEPAEVEVSLHKEDGVAVLEVKDNGLGIPEHERTEIFKKFYRIGSEETRSTKGTGLGLFIVKKIVDMHGGEIIILDNEPKGTVMRVEFPE